MFRAVITKAIRQPPATQLKLHFGELPVASSCVQAPKHYSITYLKSKVEEAPEKYTAFEKSYKEWKYVEKLIPHQYVPEAPTDPKLEFPSGWRPPNPPKDSSYLIQRTRNHMVPVYLVISFRGQRQITKIRNVVGNIFKLEEDIGKYLQPFFKSPVITYVHELSRTVHIRGDKVELTKQWLISHGF